MKKPFPNTKAAAPTGLPQLTNYKSNIPDWYWQEISKEESVWPTASNKLSRLPAKNKPFLSPTYIYKQSEKTPINPYDTT